MILQAGIQTYDFCPWDAQKNIPTLCVFFIEANWADYNTQMGYLGKIGENKKTHTFLGGDFLKQLLFSLLGN